MTIPPVQFIGLISLEEKVLALPQCLQKPRGKKSYHHLSLGWEMEVNLVACKTCCQMPRGEQPRHFSLLVFLQELRALLWREV